MRARSLVIAILLVSAPAAAHGLRAAHLEITEVASGRAIAQLHLGGFDPTLALASRDGCAIAPIDDAMFTRTWRIDCVGPLAGHHLALDGLGPLTSDAVVTVISIDGATSTQIVLADAPDIAMPTAATPAGGVARQFVGLGLVHILTGFDHLLFLVLIVLLLRDARSVLLAESAFTVSHSLSFSATATGLIHVSSTAAETCIAVSLLLLAADIDVSGPPVSRWRGAAMALVFGLVHGLGFAGGLREIGLPDHAIASALLGFATGIELGQIGFLAVVLVVFSLLRRASHTRLQLAILYAIGGFSGYLVLARGFELFS